MKSPGFVKQYFKMTTHLKRKFWTRFKYEQRTLICFAPEVSVFKHHKGPNVKPLIQWLEFIPRVFLCEHIVQRDLATVAVEKEIN